MPDAGQRVFPAGAGVDEFFGEGSAGRQRQLVGALRCKVEAILHNLPPLAAMGTAARTPTQNSDQVGDLVGDCFIEHLGRIEMIGLQIEPQTQPTDDFFAAPA